MIRERHAEHHSDLAPSSKDWQPGSVGRDEDYTPEKDLWAKTHPEEEVQPGTKKPGRSWTSENPDTQDPDEVLDKELEDTFPASDPPASTNPTGWDVEKK